ncbi:MAG: hypothetical protein FWG14_14240 [Peptococcaceae bacterium]|nr:hypothetical protein [Peptococcaceae bacterium]
MTNMIESMLELYNPQIEFEWETRHATNFLSDYLTNDRLFNVLNKVGYKAVMGVATTLTELIQLRSEIRYPYIDAVREFAPKIEALWAAAINPFYLRKYNFDYEYFDKDKIQSTYFSNWFVLRYVAGRYIKGWCYIHRYLVNLSMLTRHLMPNRNLFDKWFAETLCKTAEVFPCAYDYDDLDRDDKKEIAVYDCSNDPPVPREFFFDPKFQYSEETAKPVLNTFLQSLDYNSNPWLSTPEEMLIKGFKGTPYEV